MKKVKFLLVAAALLMCASALAQQVDLSDPKYAKWGATTAEREQNMLNSSFLKEEIANRNYDEASRLLHQLLEDCPDATRNIYINGANLYKNRINRAKNLQEKETYIDSLLWLYDMREKYMGSDSEQGRAYILDRKACEILTYRPNDREGVRKAFRIAIDAGGKNVNPEIVVVYFANLTEDYKNTDEVLPTEVISEYERLAPLFGDTPEAVEFKKQLDAVFGMSGVASCENLEKIFREKLAAKPDDETTLKQAVMLMGGAKCDSEFFLSVAERYYAVAPSSETALFLASEFQNKNNFSKAAKYLREALDTEKDPAERQKLLVQMAMVGIASNDLSTASSAARQARDLNPEDGVPYFVLAQCYAQSAAGCSGIDKQAVFWAAYDTMAKAVELLPSNSQYIAPARTAMANYRRNFPTVDDCFYYELKEGTRYTVTCGMAAGVVTTVRGR